MAKPLLYRLIACEPCTIEVINGSSVYVCFADGMGQKYQLTARRLQRWIDEGKFISMSFVGECVSLMYSHYQKHGR